MKIEFEQEIEADDEGEVLGNFIDELGSNNETIETYLTDIAQIEVIK